MDPEAIVGPVSWDIKLIAKFMLVFGPISSIFDFLTFYVLLAWFEVGAAVFQTGWFIVSMTTQILVVFVIRTRRIFFKSRPHRLLVATALGTLMVAIGLPLSPVGSWYGFVAPPPLFFVYLIGATIAYLALVAIVKDLCFRHGLLEKALFDRLAEGFVVVLIAMIQVSGATTPRMSSSTN